MAQSQIQQYSLEELRRALAPTVTGVDTALIGQQARQGADLASTLESRRLEQEQRAQSIQQEIARLKAQRDQADTTNKFIQSLPEDQRLAASVNPEMATKNLLSPDKYDTVNTAEGVFRVNKSNPSDTVRLGSPVPFVLAGQKAEAAKQATAEIQQKAAQVALDKAKSGLGILDEVEKKINPKTAGAGAYTAGVPVLGQITGATNLAADIQTVKSRLGLDALLEAKATSKAGASGFGQLSDKEMQILQSQVANLDQVQSPDQLKERVREIRKHYTNVIHMYEGKNPYNATDNPAPAVEAPANIPNIGDTFNGARVKSVKRIK